MPYTTSNVESSQHLHPYRYVLFIDPFVPDLGIFAHKQPTERPILLIDSLFVGEKMVLEIFARSISAVCYLTRSFPSHITPCVG